MVNVGKTCVPNRTSKTKRMSATVFWSWTVQPTTPATTEPPKTPESIALEAPGSRSPVEEEIEEEQDEESTVERDVRTSGGSLTSDPKATTSVVPK